MAEKDVRYDPDVNCDTDPTQALNNEKCSSSPSPSPNEDSVYLTEGFIHNDMMIGRRCGGPTMADEPKKKKEQPDKKESSKPEEVESSQPGQAESSTQGQAESSEPGQAESSEPDGASEVMCEICGKNEGKKKYTCDKHYICTACFKQHSTRCPKARCYHGPKKRPKGK